MAKPNYQFEKRQKELAKKTKKEEKRRLKEAGRAVASEESLEVALPVVDDLPGTVVAALAQ